MDKEKMKRIIEILKEPEAPAQREIKRIKAKLGEDDYKVLKCMECFLAQKELPYDIEELHRTRDILRAEINRLEKQE